MISRFNGNKSAKGQGFDGNPQNINRKGRPRKTIGRISKELKDSGYPQASMDDIRGIYLHLIQIPQSRLNLFIADAETPIIVKVIAKGLIDEKGFDVIEKMLDRSIGKAVQKIETDIKLNDENPLKDKLLNLSKKVKKEKKVNKKTK